MSNFYPKPTTSEIRGSANFTDLNGEGLDFAGEAAAFLAWTEPSERVVISGSSDVTQLTTIRGALLKLKEEFFTGSDSIVIEGHKKELFERRMFMLEHEMDGILRRRINFSVKEGDNTRVLDYTNLLNEKETQIVELEKKIQNLEERLRRASKREGDLENEIVRLKGVIKTLNVPNVSKADIDKLLIGTQEFYTLEGKYTNLRAQFAALGGLMRTQFDKLRTTGARLDLEANINQLINSEGLNIQVVNGIAQITDYRDKVVEVPIQDARTKHLIHIFALQLKKFVEKYPKLRD
jgi:hypothetical protein